MTPGVGYEQIFVPRPAIRTAADEVSTDGLCAGLGRQTSTVFLADPAWEHSAELSPMLVMRRGLRLEELEADELEVLHHSRTGHPWDRSLLLPAGRRPPARPRGSAEGVRRPACANPTGGIRAFSRRPRWRTGGPTGFRDDRAALFGGLGVMLWPLFVRYGATLYSETVALPLFTGFFLAMPDTRQAGDGRCGGWFGAGVVLGLCMHYRPMYLLYSPLAALVAYWRGRAGWPGAGPRRSLAAGCLTVVVPWSLFMTAREGTPVLLCSEGGETIAGGLNPELLRIERE